MKLSKFTYFEGKTKKSIQVKECKSIWSKFSGLMFRKNSPPLLFIFNKEKNLSIHSLFCKPFKAIWIDDKMRVTKKIAIAKIGFNFSGLGRYLLEVPFPTIK
jgi:uncharacterized membrane protein (UPF0127 family)